MVKSRSGVILTLSASPARLAIAMTGGFGVACAAVEGLSRTLAAELGPQSVRVVCLRPHRIGETMVDADFPVPRDEFIGFLEGMTLTKKLPTLARCWQYGGIPGFGSRGGDIRRGSESDLRDERRLAACAVFRDVLHSVLALIGARLFVGFDNGAPVRTTLSLAAALLAVALAAVPFSDLPMSLSSCRQRRWLSNFAVTSKEKGSGPSA
jgi:hypothetical protein